MKSRIKGKNRNMVANVKRALLEKTTRELTEYALALNGDVCMPIEATEMMSSKYRVLNLVKHLNHALQRRDMH